MEYRAQASSKRDQQHNHVPDDFAGSVNTVPMQALDTVGREKRIRDTGRELLQTSSVAVTPKDFEEEQVPRAMITAHTRRGAYAKVCKDDSSSRLASKCKDVAVRRPCTAGEVENNEKRSAGEDSDWVFIDHEKWMLVDAQQQSIPNGIHQ